VRTAPIYATVSLAPWEDLTGSLTDGFDYYYHVEHAGGLPLLLSAHAHDPMDAVRLGVNDGDPVSAPVDALTSTVSVSPATIPADGITAATVTFVPMDASGVRLGSGLELDVDLGLLLPGTLAGPVQDQGDGTYSFLVVSSTVGGGTVSVTVEGVMLNDSPTVTYQAP